MSDLTETRKTFLQLCAGAVSQEARREEQKLDEAKKSIESTQSALTEETRNLDRLYEMLRGLESGQDVFAERLGKEIDALFAIPKILDIEITSDQIILTTATLYCLNSSTSQLHEIGAFEIAIYIMSSSQPIRWKNKTRTVNGYNENMNAPHVYADGTACLGNTAGIFPELIQKQEYALAAQLAIEFVESANIMDPAGKFLYKWPLA